jgi:hypothetical protein
MSTIADTSSPIQMALPILRAARLRAHPVRPRDKRPLLNDWQLLGTDDEAVHEEWIAKYPNANVGVCLGLQPSGWTVFVIDLDVVDGIRDGWDVFGEYALARGQVVPNTFTVRTGGGGLQLYFYGSPDVAVPNKVKVLPGVDVRGDDGQCVFPPSIHPNGTPYEVQDHLPFAEAPGWLLELVGAYPRGTERPRSGKGPDPAVDGPPIPERERNDTLFRIGSGLRAKGVSSNGIFGHLVDVNENRCQPPLGPDEVKEIADSAAKYDPGMGDLPNWPRMNGQGDEPLPPPPGWARTLDQCHETFQKWFGGSYDLDVLDAILATRAAELLDGDPLWTLVVGGSGSAKTETAQALSGTEAEIVSTLSGPAALLSGSSKKERSANSTGGLLKKLEPRGFLVIKDFTSILSMSGDARQSVLAALREIHDGYWRRELGVDGGTTLEWRGRIGLVGAVTTAWDTHHSVIASLGDRFVLVRTDSTGTARMDAGARALANIGHEQQMRSELAEAVRGVLVGVDPQRGDLALTAEEGQRLLAAANLATVLRTPVEIDYRREVVSAHALEMPTRFPKELGMMVRGGIALGMERERAMALALRCARDSCPPLKLACLEDVWRNPYTLTRPAAARINRPHKTVDREMEALQSLGLIVHVDQSGQSRRGDPATYWAWVVARGIDPRVLDPAIDLATLQGVSISAR